MVAAPSLARLGKATVAAEILIHDPLLQRQSTPLAFGLLQRQSTPLAFGASGF